MDCPVGTDQHPSGTRCYGPYHTLALHEWEQSTAKAYAASLSSSTKIYGEYLDRYYEQVRKYQSASGPRGTVIGRVGILDSPISLIIGDHATRFNPSDP